MTFLGEKIGPGGQKALYVDYFPPLAILDIQEILERVGPKWQNPGSSERHSVQAMDDILIDWVNFCDAALKGRQIGINTIEKRAISLDLESIESYIIFHSAIGGNEKYPEIITSVRDAFTVLLSEDARKRIGKDKLKVTVKDNLRTAINQLIKGVGQQGDQHSVNTRQKMAEFDSD